MAPFMATPGVRPRRGRRLLAAALLAAAATQVRAGAPPQPVPSQQHYTSADGLLVDDVGRLLVDRDGFVWIATSRGVSIFDGERFENTTDANGFAGGQVFDVAQAPDGAVWIAAAGGLFRVDLARARSARAAFERVLLDAPAPERAVHRLAIEAHGTVWAGTFHDVVRIERRAGAWVPRRVMPQRDGAAVSDITRVQALEVGPQGDVWVGTHAFGILRIAHGAVAEHLPATERGADFARAFAFDDEGRVWVAFLRGVARLESGGGVRARHADLVFGIGEGLPSHDVTALLRTADGRLLVASTAGITTLARDAARRWTVGATINRSAGLPGDDVSALARDAAGQLWIALRNRGLVRRAAAGFVTHSEVDQPGFRIVSLFEDARGRPSALTRSGGARMTVWQFDGQAFRPQPVDVPATVDYMGWLFGKNAVQCRDGSWWIGSGRGLLQWDDATFAGAAALARPHARWLRAPAELASDEVTFVREDTRGDLWIGSQSPGADGVSRVAHGTRRAARVPVVAAGAAPDGPLDAAEVPAGTNWMLFFRWRLFRSRGAAFEEVVSPLLEPARIGALAADSRGRLWLLGNGVLLVPDPAAAAPRVERVPLPAELGVTSVSCAVDDGSGTMWFGTEHGVLRMDPERRAVRPFTAADGLPGNVIQLCARDRAGRLWFSDLTRVARRDPGPDPVEPLPLARLREIRVGGEPVPLPPLGTTAAEPVEIPAGRNALTVSFSAPHAATSRRPRFQVRLGSEGTPWESPGASRSVHYASLAPGRYRFEVRTASEDGRSAGPAAFVDVRVLAPFWRRGWFVALVAAALAALGYAAYRVRLARALEVERVRTRIATDLHDDIGSSLSQIAILAQVARRDAARGDPRGIDALDRITDLAGEVVEAMSDVVWAISPRGDRLDQLVSRMRRFAIELFAEADVVLRLDLPAVDAETAPLDADSRRQVFLVFKEALRNALRHSGARTVEVTLRREGPELVLHVRDDGRGLAEGDAGRGHGLVSITRRAARIGAALAIRPSAAGGVEIELRTGAAPPRRFPFKRTGDTPAARP